MITIPSLKIAGQKAVIGNCGSSAWALQPEDDDDLYSLCAGQDGERAEKFSGFLNR